MKRVAIRTACYLALAAALVGAVARPAEALESGKETFTGTVIPLGSIGPRGSMQFTAYIDGYCTDEQRKMLAQALVAEGQAGLMKVMRKTKMGRIQVGPRTGYPINVAISLPTPDGGRLVRLVTERPITVPELYSGSRSRDYQFGFIELELDAEGKGKGQLVFAAQLNVQKNGTVELENYGNNPAMISGVKQH